MEEITKYFTIRYNTKLILHLIVYVTFTIIYSNLPDDDFIINSDLSKQYNRLYFSAITHTTIGYGDISPKSSRCKLITMIHAFIVLYLYL